MEALLISKDLLVVIASVIPMLIIASFLDGDAQRRLRHYPRNIQDYWISMIVLVLFGELLALICIDKGGANWWQGLIIWAAVMSVLIYVLMIALWRIRGTSLGAYSGLEPHQKKRKK